MARGAYKKYLDYNNEEYSDEEGSDYNNEDGEGNTKNTVFENQSKRSHSF